MSFSRSCALVELTSTIRVMNQRCIVHMAAAPKTTGQLSLFASACLTCSFEASRCIVQEGSRNEAVHSMLQGPERCVCATYYSGRVKTMLHVPFRTCMFSMCPHCHPCSRVYQRSHPSFATSRSLNATHDLQAPVPELSVIVVCWCGPRGRDDDVR